MKKTLLSFLTALLISSSWAQPAGEYFPDFTVQDLDGTTHNLQTYLDDGKIVVIDVFATWCSNCQSSVPGLEELYNTHGQAGDGTMVVLSFERDASTNNELTYIAQYGIESPVITEATELIADLWNITYQPRYFVICPDGTFQSELVFPIYSDPQPLIDLASECTSPSYLTELDGRISWSLISVTSEGLEYHSSYPDSRFHLMDVTGTSVMEGQLELGKGELDISSLNRGIYLISVEQGGSMSTKRFVKR